MLIGKIDTAIASARLWVLLLKMRAPAPFYKIWGSLVLNQARANARAKGGRTLWEKIAESVHLKRLSHPGEELAQTFQTAPCPPRFPRLSCRRNQTFARAHIHPPRSFPLPFAPKRNRQWSPA